MQSIIKRLPKLEIFSKNKEITAFIRLCFRCKYYCEIFQNNFYGEGLRGRGRLLCLHNEGIIKSYKQGITNLLD